ncbi:ABC transporter [Caulobacter flavus]|uniref:ABC transporter n=1 Tax=Caulobacter flavus TaxID=1679497 RepID=A0A2N5CKH3_9CAUL|nr:ATP-binding cassette domain-containing protein [Caulobacter flavus]AYV47657.1 ABC transporter [Caulobacter flavus]PLR05845.1 ABC transporter [Caulobacter flavus]
MRSLASTLAVLGAIAAALAMAATLDSYYAFVLGQIALLTIVGVGLNILVGLGGQMSFGHAGVYAIGAYAVAVLTTRLGVSFWIAWPLGALLAGGVGALMAIPALRLKGPYLAMVTIAFGLIVEHGLVELRDVTGGQNGILDIPPPSLFGATLDANGMAVLAVAVAGMAMLAFARLSAGGWGAAMRAVRDADVAAASVGLNPTVIRTLAFSLSALFAGAAGGLFAPMAGFVTPQTFNLTQSILFVLVVVLGGSGTRLGPLLGALVVGLLPELLSGFEAYRILVFGALLMVVLWLAPRGLAGLWNALPFKRKTTAPPIADAAPPLAELLSDRPRAALRAQDLGMRFGGLRALDGARFSLPPGQVTALIGPNGAGKSTVMNLLSGFYRPTDGLCLLGEAPLPRQAFAAARAGVARSYQTSQVFQSLSVEDNVLLAARRGRLGAPLARFAGQEQRRKARALLRACGYGGDPTIPAGDLAHVDRRLVEIARALALDPDVLLLDEPAAGLSQEDKRRLAVLLKEIAAADVAVGLIEHDMGLVMGVSDTVVVLNAGMQIAQGTPSEIQADPAVRAAYLGAAPASAPIDRGPVSRLDALRVVNLTAGYGAAPVLSGVEIEVRQGEAVALLGANGAGKSTLMRVIAGLHPAADGQVAFEGGLLNSLSANERVRKGVVLSPEGRQVFPELTVRDNIRLGAFLDRRDIEARTQAMLARFPRLAERLHQRAGLLSGGEQQMLALARALMSKPKVLLLDEPSLGLAPRVIDEIFGAFRDLRDQDLTLLIVDQMAGLALSISDRAYVLSGGQVVAQGRSAQIAADPAVNAAYLGG